MNKIDFIFDEHLNTLQAANGIIKGYHSVNNVESFIFQAFSKEK